MRHAKFRYVKGNQFDKAAGVQEDGYLNATGAGGLTFAVSVDTILETATRSSIDPSWRLPQLAGAE